MFVEVAREDLFRNGDMMGFRVHGRPVLITKVAGVWRAYEDRCAHLGVALSQGELQGTTLTCKAHHWQYDVTTGSGINPRATALRAVPLRIEGGRVFVDVAVLECGAHE